MLSEPRPDAVPLSKPLAPVRCTMPVPCGACWYCRVHDGRQAYPVSTYATVDEIMKAAHPEKYDASVRYPDIQPKRRRRG